VFCTADVFECPDGSFVSRDAANDCQFKACPCTVLCTVCTDDAMICPDGSVVSRDPDNNCEFKACPIASKGSKDLKSSKGSKSSQSFRD
jgi:hypothetical protein